MITRRELALDSFWTDWPLVRLYIATTGAAAFSLRQLIAFAEQLPDATFLEMSEATLCRRRLVFTAPTETKPSAQRTANRITA